MPRTDENGRSLESLLTYLLDGVSASDISAALGVSHATYYRRKREDSYPNAEELRIIADHFDLNPVDLMVRFALVSADDAARGSGRPVATTKGKTRRTSITPRVDLAGPSL
jgi:transcriptional regulator with XRE-family HTH domain